MNVEGAIVARTLLYNQLWFWFCLLFSPCRLGNRKNNWSLYHKCLEEMARVCRPGTGRAVLLTQDKKCMVQVSWMENVAFDIVMITMRNAHIKCVISEHFEAINLSSLIRQSHQWDQHQTDNTLNKLLHFSLWPNISWFWVGLESVWQCDLCIIRLLMMIPFNLFYFV